MIYTTPEIIQPNQLQAYEERDFSTIVVGGSPNGSDCLRLNQAAGSNKQQLFQTLRTDSMAWPAQPAENALTFWINRRGAFSGSSVGWANGTVVQTLPAAGGLIMGLGDARVTTVTSIGFWGILSWGIVGTNTDDLYLVYSIRQSGSPYWSAIKLADLALDTWTFITINFGSFVGGEGANTPAQGTTQAYRDGVLVYSMSNSQNSTSWVSRQASFDTSVTRFAIGDFSNANVAVQAAAPGPICDLSEIAFHTRKLTNFEILNLYEAMLYGA